MAKTIDDKIKDIQNLPGNDNPIRSKLQEQAIAVILTATETDEWAAFMANFVDNGNTAQIARLKLDDDMADDPYIRKAAAYLIANSTCGGFTPARLNEGINGIFDI